MGLANLPAKVFISYSHQDREFVHRLADELMRHNVLVWWDEWEIGVGDSLIDKVEEGITASSYLAVVLSPSSISSPWVRQELNAALIRQLNEQRVVVLPLLISDCEIPPLLRDKRYADFREDFTIGLVGLLRSIDPPDTRTHGEGEQFKYYNDYAIEWGQLRENYGYRVFISSHSMEFPHSVSCIIAVIANDRLTERLDGYIEAEIEWAPELLMASISRDQINQIGGVILIEGDLEAISTGALVDPSRGIAMEVEIRARRLGPDPGQDLLYEWRSVLEFVLDQHIEGIRRGVSREEWEKYQEWLSSHPI